MVFDPHHCLHDLLLYSVFLDFLLAVILRYHPRSLLFGFPEYLLSLALIYHL